MPEDLVMRSVYLPPTEDSQLRQLAHDLSVAKSDLIRSAISIKLREWLGSNSRELVLHDLTFGQRERAGDRNVRAAAPKSVPARAAAKKLGGAKSASRVRRIRPSAVLKPKADRRKAAATSHRQPEMAEV